MSIQEHLNVIQNYFDLWNAHGTDPTWLHRAEALFAKGCRVADRSTGDTSTGRRGWERSARLVLRQYDDLSFEMTHLAANEEGLVVAEVIFRAECHGSPVRICQLYLFRLLDGLIADERIYYDHMGVHVALGLATASPLRTHQLA